MCCMPAESVRPNGDDLASVHGGYVSSRGNRRVAGQESLWTMLQQDDLEIPFQGADDYERIRALMHKYRDHPMDLADAWTT